MADYHFGEVAGEPMGSVYENRADAKDARVHQVTQQGIAGNRQEGCASIVLSGGYDTDEDYGHEIFYTGRGGQDPNNRRGPHIADQDLTVSDNAALVRSEETGFPIRIVRGAGHDSRYAPAAGYRYDGLYRVVAHYPHRHVRDGYIRWIFHLIQLTSVEAVEHTPAENIEADLRAYAERDLAWGSTGGSPSGPEPEPSSPVDPFFGSRVVIPHGETAPGTAWALSQRIIRDTKVTAAVKSLYAHACQMCGLQLAVKNGMYAEGAHIRPLGRPHHGPDTMSNILCLCPNHHAGFDKGGVYIGDDLTVHDAIGALMGALRVHSDHSIDLNNIRYHRTHHGYEGVVSQW